MKPSSKKNKTSFFPFILLLNANVIHSNYFNEIFKNHRKHLQLIIPNGKIHYEKLDKETNTKEILKRTAFYSLFVCYKMDIPNEKLYLVPLNRFKVSEIFSFFINEPELKLQNESLVTQKILK